MIIDNEMLDMANIPIPANKLAVNIKRAKLELIVNTGLLVIL